jgi:pilus assembly protein CpaE
VDIGYDFSNSMLEFLKILDSILLILSLDLAAVRNAKHILTIFGELDLLAKTKLVINRYDKRYAKSGSAITPQDLVKTLNMPIFHSIPNDYITISECINLGLSVVTEKHKSPITQSFLKLAELVSTADVAGAFENKL